MKCHTILCICVVLCYISESESFKLLTKLKDMLHPTVTTTPVLPTVPEYESKQGGWGDSKKWKDSGESSESSEENKNGYLSSSSNKRGRPDRVKPYENEAHVNNDRRPTTAAHNDNTYNYNSPDQTSSNGYNYDRGDRNQNRPDSFSNLDESNTNQEIRTTTVKTSNDDSYYQNRPQSEINSFKNGRTTTESNFDDSYSQNSPKQSSFDGFNNQDSITTEKSYDPSYNQNSPKQSSFEGFNSQNTITTERIYDYSYGQTTPKQSSFGSFNNKDATTSEKNNYDSYGEDSPKQSSSFDTFNNGEVSTSTSKSLFGSSNDQNQPDQTDLFEVFDMKGSTTEKYGSSFNQNNQDQTSVFGNNDRGVTTTIRYYDGSYDVNRPEQSSTFSSHGTGTASSGYDDSNYQNRPEQSAFSGNNLQTVTTTQRNEDTYSLNKPEQSSVLSSFSNQGSEATTVKNVIKVPNLSANNQSSYPRDQKPGNLNQRNQSSNFNTLNNQNILTTTPKYSSYKPELPAASNSLGSGQYTTITTSTVKYNTRPSSLGTGQPSLTNTGKESNVDSIYEEDTGDIVFPDNEMLEQTTEIERVFSESAKRRIIDAHKTKATTGAPVGAEDGKGLLDPDNIPPKNCGKGKRLDSTGNCRKVARK